MINTDINFMGFYESIHSYFIDQAIESYFSDDDGNFNDKEAENINYKTIHDSYIKDFTNDFEGWIKDNYPLTPSFCNLKLISPKYYNYSTDIINCDMNESDVISMNNFFKDDKRNKYMKIRQTILDSKATDFSDLYTLLYDKVDDYAGENTANVILVLGDGVAKSAIAIDKEIILFL